MAKSTNSKKFKVTEKNAYNAPVKDIPWEGEEIYAQSKTQITDDTGEGQIISLQFFTFGANPQDFQTFKPTAQMLFNNHARGIESLLWSKGLKIIPEVEPRLLFSTNGKVWESYSPLGKQYTHYQIVVAATPQRGFDINNKPKTLSQLLTNAPIS